MMDGVSFLQNFDNEWQRKLLRVILQDHAFAESLQEVLDLNYFSIESYKIILKSFFNFREKYKVYPAIDNLISIVGETMKKTDKAQWIRMKELLTAIKVEGSVFEAEFVKDSAIKFCKKKKMTAAILKATELLSSSSEDEVYEEITKMVTAISNASIVNESGHHFVKDFALRYKENFREAITTGIPELDEITMGGLGKKELGVAVGGTGSGKSMFLSSLGAAALLNNYKVFYYTLELADVVIGRRFDARISGIPINELFRRKEDVYKKISATSGNLLIKEFPGKKTTLQKLYNHIKKEIRSGNYPDVIFVDYADLLKFQTTYAEKRHNLEELFEELRGIAQELNVAIWTVSQTNRNGYQSELVNLDDISESFAKVFCADLVVTIARTAEQKEQSLATFQVAKNRNGIDGVIFDGIMNTSLVDISFIKRTRATTMEDIKQKAAQFIQSSKIR